MVGRQAVWKDGVPRANPAARGLIYTPKRARAVTVRRRRRGPVLVQIDVMGRDIGPAAEPVNPGIGGGEMQKGRPEGRPLPSNGVFPAQPFGSQATGIRRYPAPSFSTWPTQGYGK